MMRQLQQGKNRHSATSSVAERATKVLKLWPTSKHPCPAPPKADLMRGGSMPWLSSGLRRTPSRLCYIMNHDWPGGARRTDSFEVEVVPCPLICVISSPDPAPVAFSRKTCPWHQAETDRFTRETGSPLAPSRHPKHRKHAQRR
jgi:hypothetical protein